MINQPEIDKLLREREELVRKEVMRLLQVKKEECLKINESARAKHVQSIMDFLEKNDFLKSSRTQ